MEQALHDTQPGTPVAPARISLRRAGLALALIVCGLSLRWYGFPLGLPAFVVKYGGSLLWATMVFLLVGALLPRLTRIQLATIAMVIAAVVEFSRLVHTPWLDAFRLTTAGALLLGRIFSLWNLAAYAVGIASRAGLIVLLNPTPTISLQLKTPHDLGLSSQPKDNARTCAMLLRLIGSYAT